MDSASELIELVLALPPTNTSLISFFDATEVGGRVGLLDTDSYLLNLSSARDFVMISKRAATRDRVWMCHKTHSRLAGLG